MAMPGVQTGVIDMGTVEGLVEHLRSLTSEALEAIVLRPVWNAESAKMNVVAATILDLRGER